MKLFVTGSNGFVGKNLINSLRDDAIEIVEIKRHDKENKQLNFDLRHFNSMVKDEDWVIHLAWDMNERKREKSYFVNVEGTKKFLNNLSSDIRGRTIYLSSLSADKNSKSVYGYHKYLIEEEILNFGGKVLRAAIVCDNNLEEGFVGKLKKLAMTFKILPNFWGKSPVFQITYIDDIVLNIKNIIQEKETKAVSNIFSSEPLNFRSLILKITNKPPLLIRLPWSLGYLFLKSIELFGINIGVSSDSILSLHPKTNIFRMRKITE